jgi:hypothetical protein
MTAMELENVKETNTQKRNSQKKAAGERKQKILTSERTHVAGHFYSAPTRRSTGAIRNYAVFDLRSTFLPFLRRARSSVRCSVACC